MKNKTHSLPKSIRAVKRYFKLDCNFEEIKKLKNYFLDLHGILKFAESDFSIKDLEDQQIIKINRDFEKELMVCVDKYNEKNKEKIKIVKKSGTLKSLVI